MRTAAGTVVFVLGAFAHGAFVLAAIRSGAVLGSSDPKHPINQPQTVLYMVRWGASLIAAAFVAMSIAMTARYERYELSAGRMAHLRATSAEPEPEHV